MIHDKQRVSMKGAEQTNSNARSRLTRAVDREELLPWVRAQNLEDTFLYWLPMENFPPRHDQRSWLLEFLVRWNRALTGQAGLRSELFLQYKTACQEPVEEFQRYALRNSVMPGYSRKPGTSVNKFPAADEMMKAMQSGDYDMYNWVPDLCYWFVTKKPAEQQEKFFGRGGMTILFLPPDPKTAPMRLPFTAKYRAAMPVFQHFDVDAIVAGVASMQDVFLAKSKQLFGSGLEQEVTYPGIKYIIPLLTSGHFFTATAEERESWFTLFDVYINESPADKGLVMAFQKDFEPMLLETLESMRRDGLKYAADDGMRA